MSAMGGRRTQAERPKKSLAVPGGNRSLITYPRNEDRERQRHQFPSSNRSEPAPKDRSSCPQDEDYNSPTDDLGALPIAGCTRLLPPPLVVAHSRSLASALMSAMGGKPPLLAADSPNPCQGAQIAFGVAQIALPELSGSDTNGSGGFLAGAASFHVIVVRP